MRPRGSDCARSFAGPWSAAAGIAAARILELAAAAAALALYLPSLGYGFVFDDLALIGGDGAPVPLGGVLPYRPLRYASYALDSWLGGSPAVYHLHNVLLHALVAALVVALARRLGALSWAALAAGLFVAVHPLALEAAAYVSGRRDLLCVALGLAAVHAQLGGRRAVALALLVAATAAKESALVFAAPLVAASLAGLDAPRSRPRAQRAEAGNRVRTVRAGAGALDDSVAFDEARASSDAPARPGVPAAGTSAHRRLPSIVATLVAAMSGLALAVAYGAVGPWMPPASVAAWAMPGHVVLHYVGSLVGTHVLAPEYPSLIEAASRLARGDLEALVTGFAAGVLVAAATATALAACVRAAIPRTVASQAATTPRTATPRAARAFAIAWTAAVLSAIGIWGGLHEPGADRHAYLLLPALGVTLALLVPHRIERRPLARSAAATAAVVLLAVAAGATHAQMPVWQGERTPWTHALAHAPSSPRAHANLARVHAAGGDWRAAAAHMNAALAADPGDPLLYIGRASVRCAEERPSLVRRDLRRALERGADASLVRALGDECGVRFPPRRRAEATS